MGTTPCTPYIPTFPSVQAIPYALPPPPPFDNHRSQCYHANGN